MAYLTDIPTPEELIKIITIRRQLLNHEFILYRELRDIQSEYPLHEDRLKSFQLIANALTNVSSFKATLYYYFITLKVDNYTAGGLKSISDYLIQNYYIHSVADMSRSPMSTSRFYNVEDGTRWILAYRVTVAYYLGLMDGVLKDDPHETESLRVYPMG